MLCGGNIDPRLAASIMVRELAREERILSVRLISADRPGVLAMLAKTIAEAEGNILEVSHHRTFLKIAAKGAVVDVTIETHGRDHAAKIMEALRREGYRPERLDPL